MLTKEEREALRDIAEGGQTTGWSEASCAWALGQMRRLLDALDAAETMNDEQVLTLLCVPAR